MVETGDIRRGTRAIVERPATVFMALIGLILAYDLITGLREGTIASASVATFLWDGLVLGMVVGIAGIGLSMTYGILNFANFSHGDLVTTGAFTGWIAAFFVAGATEFSFGNLFMLGGPAGIDVRILGISIFATPGAVLVGLIASAVMTIGITLVIDRYVYKPMRDASGISLLIASVGVALVLRYLIVVIWGGSTVGLTANVPSFTVPVGDGAINVDAHEITLVVVSFALMVGVHMVLQRTKLGTAMRAMADNEDLARVTGIPTERVVRTTWILGGGMAGMAGYLVALERGTLAFDLGWVLLLLIFAAVILGGIGSVYGAMLGGIIIGITSRLSLIWIPSDFLNAAAFTIMILVLLYRPKGIFSGVTTA